MASNKSILSLVLCALLFNSLWCKAESRPTTDLQWQSKVYNSLWCKAESRPTTDLQWQSKVYANINAKSSTTSNVWKELLVHGTITGKKLGKDKRRIFTLVQASVEEELVAALNSKSIKSAVIIIHALMPPTSLRIGLKSDDLNVKQLNVSPKSQAILLQRRKILNKYLEAGGTLVSAYKYNSKLEKTKGFKQYLAHTEKYKLLLDRPVKDVPSKYWGATYLIRQLDDSILSFCINSSQASLLPDNADLEWQMWLGPLLETKISKRIVQVESFLKSENIDIYEVLGFRSKD